MPCPVRQAEKNALSCSGVAFGVSGLSLNCPYQDLTPRSFRGRAKYLKVKN